MREEFEFKAKTPEEAIEKGKAELGEKAETMEFEIVKLPTSGFFGIGATPAVVKFYRDIPESKSAGALDFIKTVIRNFDIEADVTESETEDGAVLLTVTGKEAGILIGHHGDTLDSLQYLANLTANHRREEENRDYTKIVLDIEGYRAKREETLRALARRVADKVLKYKKNYTLEPMNPGERRIIHSEIQGIEGVCTTSVGSDENRKVIVYLEGTSPTSDRFRSRGRGRGGYNRQGKNRQNDGEADL